MESVIETLDLWKSYKLGTVEVEVLKEIHACHRHSLFTPDQYRRNFQTDWYQADG